DVVATKLPTLDALAREPNRVAELSPEARARLLAQLAGLTLAIASVPVESLDKKPPLSVKRIAKMFDVSESTVRGMVDRGELRAMPKLGKHDRIPFAEVARVLAARR